MTLGANDQIGAAGAGETAMASQNVDLLAIDTIRILTIDPVQKARSGHAGLPLGMAPVAFTLRTRFLGFSLEDAGRIDRARSVPSAGHVRMFPFARRNPSGTLAMDRDRNPVQRPAVGLMGRRVRARVASMPSWGVFEEQALPARGSATTGHREDRVEEASPLVWDRCVDSEGAIIAMRGLDASARADALEARFGYTVDGVVAAALKQVHLSTEKE